MYGMAGMEREMHGGVERGEGRTKEGCVARVKTLKISDVSKWRAKAGRGLERVTEAYAEVSPRNCSFSLGGTAFLGS